MTWYDPADLGKITSTVGSIFHIPNMGASGALVYGDPTRIVQPAFGLQPNPAFSYEQPIISPLGEPNVKGEYSWNVPSPKSSTTGGGGQQQQQPQGGGRPEGSWDWVQPGNEISDARGVWRRRSDGGWDFMGSHADRAAAEQKTRTEEEATINGIYSPLLNSLDEQRRNLESQQPGEEARIQGAYDRGIEGVTGQQQEAQMQLAKRGTASDVAQANALANARQLYSELSQRYGAMFGSRSSAGPAAQELLGRETTRRFGEVGTAREQDRQAVADETTRLTTWTNTQKNEWLRKKNEAVETLKTVFRDKIAQINSQRGVLESQKARDRAQALTDARTKQAMVEQADRDFQQRLALFQAERQAQLTAAPQYAMNPWNSAIQGQYNPSQIGQAGSQGTPNTTVAGNGDYLWEIDPRTGQRVPRRMI